MRVTLRFISSNGTRAPNLLRQALAVLELNRSRLFRLPEGKSAPITQRKIPVHVRSCEGRRLGVSTVESFRRGGGEGK